MKINFKNSFAFILILIAQFSFAQKKDENIGTEVVNVVKPYTPIISDAFKVSETPVLDEAENSKKETIINNYKNIVSASAPKGGEKSKEKETAKASNLDEKVAKLKTIKLK